MVVVRKRKIGSQTYFYLEHSQRKGARVEKKELYLGKELPKDIDLIKKAFRSELLAQAHEQFDLIKKNYAKEQRLLPPSAKEKSLESFSIKFTYDTQRIEGSTLTLKETADLLEQGITPARKPIRDVKEAEAHSKLFFATLEEKDITFNTVLRWHKQLFEQTKPDIAGQIRKHQVAIARSKFMPPLGVEVYPLLQEFFTWYEKNKKSIHPVELAALVHLKFVTIHPFGDGNGRISRLMMNFILHKHNYPMLNIPYLKRDSYYNALERSQVKKEEHIFVQWFMKKYLQEQRTYLKKR
jgi:Fic family protein